MKKIGILSDTHGLWDDRYARHFSDCDEVWHAGDIGDYSIVERLRETVPTVRAVSGNVDHGKVARECEESETFELEGVKVYLTHIAGYPGRYSRSVKSLLKEEEVKLMVCGHSHILKVIYDAELDLLHINPGAAGNQGWQKERTLIKVILDEGKIRDLEVITLGK